MKATFVRSYPKSNTTTVFVYTVNATEEQLALYKKAQGDNYRIDNKTGDVLWFTPRYVGETANLLITSNNKVVADMSEMAKAKSMAEQYGGNFGEELAKLWANKLVGSVGKAQSNTPVNQGSTTGSGADLNSL